MNVGKLRELIQDLPDDTPVVVEGRDHSYNECTASYTDATWNRQARMFFEYAGPEHLAEGETCVRVVVVS